MPLSLTTIENKIRETILKKGTKMEGKKIRIPITQNEIVQKIQISENKKDKIERVWDRKKKPLD